MNTEKALNMIEQYTLSDCTDLEWRKCLQHLKWLVIHQEELLDGVVAENEWLRAQIKAKQELLDAAVAGQETLQKYHHNETEQAYKNGYEAGVKEFAERLKRECHIDRCYEILFEGTIDHIEKELTGGSENDIA